MGWRGMVDRRQFGKGVAALGATVAAGGAFPVWGEARERAAQVTGPISGGRGNRIFGAPAGDLAAHGYVEEESLLSGAAARYAVIGAQPPIGRASWREGGGP